MSSAAMTTPLTNAELAAIRARAEAATPGPWRWWISNSFRRLSSDATGKDGDVLSGTVQRSDGHPDIAGSDVDKDFIAHARADVPALLAEVERLNDQGEQGAAQLTTALQRADAAERRVAELEAQYGPRT